MRPTLSDVWMEFDCYPMPMGRGQRPDKKREKTRATVDKAHDLFVEQWSTGRPTSRQEMAKRVETQLRAGFPPIVGWLMWQAIAALVNRVVFWLWDRYNNET